MNKDETNATLIEQQLIANLVTAPDSIQAVKNTGITEDDFTNSDCQKLFDRIINHGDISPDLLMTSVPECSTALINMLNNISVSSYVPEWCKTLKEYTARRKVIADCKTMIVKAQDRKSDILAAIKNGCSDILEQQRRLDVRHVKTTAEMRMEYDNFIDPVKSKENVIQYGLPFDGIVKHYRGEVFTIGAAPGTGKTALALSAMLNMARNNRKVALFCQEMQTLTLIARMVANLANVRLDDVLIGKEREKCEQAKNLIFDLIDHHRILIRGCGEYTHSASGIEAELQKFYNDAGDVDFFCVDYVQTLIPNAKPKDKREQLNEDLEAIKQLAGKLNCACLLLSQQNRSGQQGALNLTALKETAHLEEISAIVAFLEAKDNDEIKFSVLKNRNGENNTGGKLLFEKAYQRFSQHVYRQGNY